MHEPIHSSLKSLHFILWPSLLYQDSNVLFWSKNKAKAKARIKNPFIKFDVHVPDIPHFTASHFQLLITILN